jgi:hypothetical protein
VRPFRESPAVRRTGSKHHEVTEASYVVAASASATIQERASGRRTRRQGPSGQPAGAGDRRPSLPSEHDPARATSTSYADKADGDFHLGARPKALALSHGVAFTHGLLGVESRTTPQHASEPLARYEARARSTPSAPRLRPPLPGCDRTRVRSPSTCGHRLHQGACGRLHRRLLLAWLPRTRASKLQPQRRLLAHKDRSQHGARQGHHRAAAKCRLDRPAILGARACDRGSRDHSACGSNEHHSLLKRRRRVRQVRLAEDPNRAMQRKAVELLPIWFCQRRMARFDTAAGSVSRAKGHESCCRRRRHGVQRWRR